MANQSSNNNEKIFQSLNLLPTEKICDVINQSDTNQLLQYYNNANLKNKFLFCEKTHSTLKFKIPITVPLEFLKNFSQLTNLYLINVKIISINQARQLLTNEYKGLKNLKTAGFQIPKMNNLYQQLAIVNELLIVLRQLIGDNLKNTQFGFEIIFDKPVKYYSIYIPSLIIHTSGTNTNIVNPWYPGENEPNPILGLFLTMFTPLKINYKRVPIWYDDIEHPVIYNFIAKGHVNQFITNADLSKINLAIIDPDGEIIKVISFKDWWSELKLLKYGLMYVGTFLMLLVGYTTLNGYKGDNWKNDPIVKTYLSSMFTSTRLIELVDEMSDNTEYDEDSNVIFIGELEDDYLYEISTDESIVSSVFYQSSAASVVYQFLPEIKNGLRHDLDILTYGK